MRFVIYYFTKNLFLSKNVFHNDLIMAG